MRNQSKVVIFSKDELTLIVKAVRFLRGEDASADIEDIRELENDLESMINNW